MFRSRWSSLSACFLGFLLLLWTFPCDAYLISRAPVIQFPLMRSQLSRCRRFSRVNVVLTAREEEEEEEAMSFDPNGEELMIFRGGDGDDIDGAVWEDLETGQPPKWLIMKQVRKSIVCYEGML